jgi:hypothetical protein
MNLRKQQRFIFGALLAWAPFAVLACVVNGISEPHLANLVAQGGNWLLTSAILTGIVVEVFAIPMLLGSFARGAWTRGVFSALSLCCATFMTLLFVVLLVVVWLGLSQFHPRG